MSNRFVEQAQLLRDISQQLEKRAFELQHYRRQDQEVQHAFDENVSDIIASTDVSALEARLNERLTFFEAQFLPPDSSVQSGQLSLLKRALIMLQSMQTALEQYQHLPSTSSQPSATLSTMRDIEQPGKVIEDTVIQSPTNPFLAPLQPMSRGQRIPLSFAQQRIWFLEQLEPGKSHYNDYVAFRLKGLLNIDALERSFSEIVRRHEILRTTFSDNDGEVYQQIAPWQPQKLALIDLQDTSIERREAHARHMAESEVGQQFDFTNGPLFKIRLYQLSEDDYLLVTIYHHTIGDGWSMGIFYYECSLLYEAYCVGETPALAELPIQYADYTLWRRQWLQGEALQKQLDYWRQQLKNAPAQLNLSTDRPRPAIQTYAGSQQSLFIPRELLLALKALSQREGATLYMTLLAAFQVLLMRYSGQEDILIGSSIANRTRRELEGLIGFFANTLVLRGDLSGNPSFRQLLKRAQEMMLQAYAHQDVPFEKLVAELNPERDLSLQPLFQVVLVFQQFPLPSLGFPGVVWSPFKLTKATSKFDLLMDLREEELGLMTTVEYSTDLFEVTTIERLLTHWQVLLEAIVRDATQPIELLPLLTTDERELLLHEWNEVDRNQERMPEEPILQLIEAQAEGTPDRIALIFEETQLTYSELNKQSNQLAHYLRQRGIGVDMLAGVCLERSLEMVISMLAIWKAGGAYVPIDPSYPSERLALLLEDTNLEVLLTHSELLPRLPVCQVQFLCIDSLAEELAVLSSENSESDFAAKGSAWAGRLAYVIYTSGSTGQPKGAMNTHEAIGNRLRWMQESYQLTEYDRILQKTPFSFDVSVWEFFWPLMSGACLVMARPDGHRDPSYLVQTIRERQITTLHFVPSMLKAFVEEPDLETCGSIRQVMCSGEALSLEQQKRFFQRLDAELHNLYGPTEAAIDVTFWPCQQTSERAIVPIGYPIVNTQIYVLDRQWQPVPIGVVGELYIGGAGLARGYWRRADLTAERFLPDPFSRKEGSRLYRTGDLARIDKDGAIEFLGRIDRQVKIRGFRVEMGEIEAAILAYPGVRTCVVAAPERAGLNKRLVAYIVANETDQLHKNDMQQFLQGRLPDYMVPASFVFLDAFPLKENGKLDFRRLEAFAEESKQSEAFLPPRTAVEMTLASIWTEVLGVKQIGIRDSFFALGGDSILSIQVVSRARQMGLQLTPRHLFLYKTIEQLSAEIRKVQPHLSEQRLELGSLPLTPVQHWFFSYKRPVPQHWNQAFRLEVSQKLHCESLERALSALLEHHDALRLRFSQRSDGSWEQWYGEVETNIPFCHVDLSALHQAEQTTALDRIEAETQSSLNLATGPILRAVFCQCDEGSTDYLLCAIHHLAVDGISWRIIFEDLQLAYTQHTQGLPVHLPPKTSSYRTWAEHLTLYANSSALKEELSYWLAPMYQQAPAIPLDLPGHIEENKESAVRKIIFSLPAASTQTLLELPLQLYETQMQEVIITALTQTLTSWIGGTMLLIDMEGHGREDIFTDVDVSRTAGWFTSIFPVSLQLTPGSSIEEALTTVREQMRRIPAHGLGYGVLYYLSKEAVVLEALRTRPRPCILFNYLGQLDQLFAPTQMFGAALPCDEATRDPQGECSHFFEINCWVANKQFHISWGYNENLHHASTVEKLGRDFLATLERYAEHCFAVSSKHSYRAEEFSDIDLNQAQLERILAIVDGYKEA